jgi:hypothetical protein
MIRSKGEWDGSGGEERWAGGKLSNVGGVSRLTFKEGQSWRGEGLIKLGPSLVGRGTGMERQFGELEGWQEGATGIPFVPEIL